MKPRRLPQFLLYIFAITLLVVAANADTDTTADADTTAEAQAILQDTGVTGGLVVHYGSGDGKLTAALRVSDAFVVHGLSTDPSQVERARAYIKSLGVYGDVSVDLHKGVRLPYADNLVNLLVAEAFGDVPMDEVLRVLAPDGVACVRNGDGWAKTVKPRPENIGSWTHALYDASNNAVAHDTIVGPPYHTQWVAEPLNARHHESLASVSVVVSAGGRLFYIIDEAPAASILIEPQWALIARDAFSGVRLWRRRIPKWASHLTPFRMGSPHISRRLVAVGDHVYVTLGYDAPVTRLDAATGKTLITYDGTEHTEEILFKDGTLYVVVGDDDGPPEIVALDADTGERIWSKTDAGLLPATLGVGGGAVCYVNGSGVVCLDAVTGDTRWTTGREVAHERPDWSSPTLVIHDDVVLCADRFADPGPAYDEYLGHKMPKWLADGGAPGKLTAHALENGEILWASLCAEGFHAQPDVFVIGDLVWTGMSRARQGPDFREALDLHTGEVRRNIAPDKAFESTMPHARCHRNRATDRYLVLGRTGVEFIDIETGRPMRHHWVRGVCQYGTVPCNGLLYVPPHSCACYIEAKLTGFLALAPQRQDTGDPPNPRLDKGPAYATKLTESDSAETKGDWPTFRHDAARTGHTDTAVPAELGVAWRREFGSRLSSPVTAAGVTLVAAVDNHTVHALDAKDGDALWTFTVGGRVDSPPTIANGRAVFGSADGFVYCLRLSDGALAWRFRAAPRDRRIVAFDRVESAWPVHGSVLIEDGVVYCTAGRTSYLDTGLYLYRLDLATGRKLAEKRFWNRNEGTGAQPEETLMFEMPGALPDVLSTDGQSLFMRMLCFDLATLDKQQPKTHLFNPAGFLNDNWWHRNYTIYGHHYYSGYIGWYFAGRETPAGRILTLDSDSVYGFSYKPCYYKGSREREYHVFATDRPASGIQPEADYNRAQRAYRKNDKELTYRVPLRWTKEIDMLGRAMVLTPAALFIAGPPEEAQRSAEMLDGAQGSALAALSTADGERLAHYALDSAPVFDGMAAADERLYLSMQNGTLLCLAGGDDGLTPLPEKE